ncbi:GDP-fucose protein O-fucosyltransferase 1 [Lamellibrachia satsuma]|nr:GDP-fucose protein O-fucosyltransferase 1 [Lamellibrachia satsuma]
MRKTELVGMCKTRCVERHTCYDTFYDSLQNILGDEECDDGSCGQKVPMHKILSSAFFFWVALVTLICGVEIDLNGYLVYCPCMGRFGNQADHFLGVLPFAKGLNRTLILPPWVEYKPYHSNSVQVPFDTYFKVKPLEEYHRVITMEKFMKTLAPKIWTPSQRVVYCYGNRKGDKENDCNAKDGNPFRPFWDTFNIDFVKSEFYASTGADFNTLDEHVAKRWIAKFPADKHPVMAFTGAPANFPVAQQNVELHRYLVWSTLINEKAEKFIQEKIPSRPFLGIHMRHASDWKNVCTHFDKDRHLFASAQCLGYNFEHGQLTMDMCMTPHDMVKKQVKKALKKMKAKSLFVAADDDHMIEEFTQYLKKMKVTVVKLDDPSPHVDLAILAKADHYIGNCVSTFSAFAVRERRAHKKSVGFWAFSDKSKREEL